MAIAWAAGRLQHDPGQPGAPGGSSAKPSRDDVASGPRMVPFRQCDTQ